MSDLQKATTTWSRNTTADYQSLKGGVTMQIKLSVEQIGNLRTIADILGNDKRSFSWGLTPEGHAFWEAKYFALCRMIKHGTSDGNPWVEPSPPLPELTDAFVINFVHMMRRRPVIEVTNAASYPAPPLYRELLKVDCERSCKYVTDNGDWRHARLTPADAAIVRAWGE